MNEETKRAVIEDQIKNYGKCGSAIRWSDDYIKLCMQLPGGEFGLVNHQTVL